MSVGHARVENRKNVLNHLFIIRFTGHFNRYHIQLRLDLIELRIGLMELTIDLMELGIVKELITPGAPSWPVYPALFLPYLPHYERTSARPRKGKKGTGAHFLFAFNQQVKIVNNTAEHVSCSFCS